MKHRWYVGALLVAVTACLALGPKIGEKLPKLALDPVNDNEEKSTELAELIGDKPGVVAFVISESEENGQLVMLLEQGYRQLKERGLKAYVVVYAKDDRRAEIKSLCDQFGVTVPVATVDPDAETLKEWDLSEAKENAVVFVKQGKVSQFFADVKNTDEAKLRDATLALFM